MDIKIQAIHFEASEKLQDFILKKVNKLEKFSEEIRKVEFWLYHNNYSDEIEDNNGRNIKTKIISYDNFYFIKE